MPLNSDDPLFCTVRDVHVEQLMPFLQDKVKSRVLFVRLLRESGEMCMVRGLGAIQRPALGAFFAVVLGRGWSKHERGSFLCLGTYHAVARN